MTDQQESNAENNPQNPEGVIVLGVFMHCEGCADTVVKYLRGYEGVEQIETDMKSHRVTVKGKKADPKKVVDRLRKKTSRRVDLISPILKKEEKKADKKKEEPKVVEVVLKILMHCEGCASDIKYRIHKMEGVRTVETDLKNSQVSVQGVFEPNTLVQYINTRIGKHAVIVKETPPAPEIKNDKNEEKDLTLYYQIDPPGLVYAPQFFSEENPNGCSVI